MKELFEKKKKLISKLNDVSLKLDQEIDKKWGFSYSDTDDDVLIDTLDYGNNNISYEEFVRVMNEYKKNYDKDGEFGIVF